jgi:hypothetical protein
MEKKILALAKEGKHELEVRLKQMSLQELCDSSSKANIEFRRLLVTIVNLVRAAPEKPMKNDSSNDLTL